MATLSPRERQILSLVATGRTSKEIAAELRISVSTVNWHLSNAFGKLGASSRAEAVALALGTREVDHASASRPAKPRPAWHGAVAALALVILGGAIVAGIDAVPAIPAPPPRPAATGGAPDVRASPTGEPTSTPATLTASPPPAPTSPAMPAVQPVASAPPQPAAPVPPLSTATVPPGPTVAPLPTVTPLPLPTVTPLPLPTVTPLPLPAPPLLPPLPLPTLGLP